MNLLRYNVIKTFDWEPFEIAINPAYIRTACPWTDGSKTSVSVEGAVANIVLDVPFETFVAALAAIVLTIDAQHGAAPAA